MSPRSAASVVFTAHGIPVAMAGTVRYRVQLLESSRLVADRLGNSRLQTRPSQRRRALEDAIRR